MASASGPAAERGHAFVPVGGQDLNRISSVQQERVVAQDNTVRWGERVWQLARTRWRGTLAGCRVTICEHLDGQVSIVYGPHVVGRYTAEGKPLEGVSQRRGKLGGEGRRPEHETMKPDRSGATKTGHFHLLTTVVNLDCKSRFVNFVYFYSQRYLCAKSYARYLIGSSP